MTNIALPTPTRQYSAIGVIPEAQRRARWHNQWIHIPETPKVAGGPNPDQPIYLRPSRENPGGLFR